MLRGDMEATWTVISDTLRLQGRSVAAQRGQTISEIVRRALQQYVNADRNEPPVYTIHSPHLE
jgi:hypothetical protein